MLIGEIVRKAQEAGTFRATSRREFAAIAFYGAIEQVLTGWIFGSCPRARTRVRAGKALRSSTTICDGLEAHATEPSA